MNKLNQELSLQKNEELLVKRMFLILKCGLWSRCKYTLLVLDKQKSFEFSV